MPRIIHATNASGPTQRRKRVTTGSIAGNASAAVTVTWDTPFADTNYTVVCAVQEAVAGTSTLRVHHIESITAAAIVVRIVNDDTLNAKTGTVHAIAIHD